jgi:N-acyl-D-amino-acid deacylase
MHDILIRNGTIIDGTGGPRVKADLAIDGPRIAGLYKPSEGKAAVTLDAEGTVVCPGFVDIHTHSDLYLLSCPLAESKIRQGVTTELLGNCGGSAAPLVGDARKTAEAHAKDLWVDVTWSTLDEYLLRLADVKTSVNVATLVGAETLRHGVIGPEDRAPSEDELADMNKLLADSMLEGAFGLSSGLIYAPGCFAKTEEIISLATTAASFGGMYASHVRGEGRTLVEAVAEAIRIGRESGCRVQVSHHKACGERNWGLVHKTLEMMEQARKEGVDVAFDVYPYTASSTNLDTVLPPWAREGSKEKELERLRDTQVRDRIKKELLDPDTEWENTVAEDGWANIVMLGFKKEANKRFENKSVQSVAEGLSKDPADVAFDLLLDEELGVGAVFHEISEDDVKTVISHPLAMVGSDGESEAPYGPTGSSPTHPRSYGTFPRALRKYSIDSGLMTLEETVNKMTARPAARMGLMDRGVLAKGMAADVVVFDPTRVRDTATYEDSHRYAEGIIHVLVNGLLTIEDGEHTKERAGQVLRHKVGVS